MKQITNVSLLFLIAVFLTTISACTGVRTDRAGDLAINDGVDKPQPVHGVSSYEGILSDSLPLLEDNDTQRGRVVLWRDGNMLYAEFSAPDSDGIENVQLCISKTEPQNEQPGDFPYFDEPGFTPAFSEPVTPTIGEPISSQLIQPAQPLIVYGPIAPVNLGELTRTSERVEGNGQTGCTASVSLLGFAAGEKVYVAASAAIRIEMPTGSYTADTWARSTAGNSSWNFTYPRTPNSNLPDGNVSFIALSGAGSTWSSSFNGIPSGMDVKSGYAYAGWCVDQYHNLAPNHGYFARLYSSYSPDLPDYCRDNDWDMVNYIINHKQGGRQDIQNAIWYFIGGGGLPDTGSARDMVDDALANGEGYVPDLDDVLAVVVAINPDTQTTIVESILDAPVM